MDELNVIEIEIEFMEKNKEVKEIIPKYKKLKKEY